MSLFVMVLWLWIGIYSFHGQLFALFLLWIFAVFPTYCVRRILVSLDPRSFIGRKRNWVLAAVFILGGFLAGMIHDPLSSATPGGSSERANYEAEIYVFVSNETSTEQFSRVPAKIKRETPLAPFTFLIPRFLTNNGKDMSSYEVTSIKFPRIGWTEVYLEESLDFRGENHVFTVAADDRWKLFLTRDAVRE